MPHRHPVFPLQRAASSGALLVAAGTLSGCHLMESELTRYEALLIGRSTESLVHLLASQAEGAPSCTEEPSEYDTAAAADGQCTVRLLDGAIEFVQTVNVPAEVDPDFIPEGYTWDSRRESWEDEWGYTEDPLTYRTNYVSGLGCEFNANAVAMTPTADASGNLTLDGTFTSEDQCALADWGPFAVPKWEVMFLGVAWAPGGRMPFAGTIKFPKGIGEDPPQLPLRQDGQDYTVTFSFENETYTATVTAASDPGVEEIIELAQAEEG